MKTSHIAFAMVCLMGTTIVSCKKKDDPNAGFPEQVTKIVPAEVVNTMRKHGMVLHEGKTPPRIEGIYLFSKNVLSGSSKEDDKIGKVYADYRYKFYDQDASTFSIKTSFKGYNATGTVISQAQGVGSFISGNNNAFTIFSEEKGQSDDGATFTTLSIYSGELTTGGIKNLQNAFYMKEKNDPDNKLVAVGTTRVFDDSDKISETQSSLRISAEQVLQKTDTKSKVSK